MVPAYKQPFICKTMTSKPKTNMQQSKTQRSSHQSSRVSLKLAQKGHENQHEAQSSSHQNSRVCHKLAQNRHQNPGEQQRQPLMEKACVKLGFVQQGSMVAACHENVFFRKAFRGSAGVHNHVCNRMGRVTQQSCLPVSVHSIDWLSSSVLSADPATGHRCCHLCLLAHCACHLSNQMFSKASAKLLRHSPQSDSRILDCCLPISCFHLQCSKQCIILCSSKHVGKKKG